MHNIQLFLFIKLAYAFLTISFRSIRHSGGVYNHSAAKYNRKNAVNQVLIP